MIIGLYPGKFKPVHKGHYMVAEQAIKTLDKLKIIISNKEKDNINPNQSKLLWELYLRHIPKDKYEIIITEEKTPVDEVYKQIKDKDNNYLLIFGKNEKRRFEKASLQENVELIDGGELENFHGRDLRQLLEGKQTSLDLKVKDYIPEHISYKDFQYVLNEQKLPEEDKELLLAEFLDFIKKELNLDSLPEIKYIDEEGIAKKNKSFANYNPKTKTIEVVTKNRNIADSWRSLSHELFHFYQDINGKLKNIQQDGETGSDIENEANSFAGIIMRKFGKLHPEIFE